MTDPAPPSPTPVAGTDDVIASFERPLTSEEARVLPAWMRAAWTVLRGTEGLRNIPARLAAEDTEAVGAAEPVHTLREDLQQVVIAMVERKLRNADGLRGYTVDDGQATVDAALSSGQLYVTAEELARLLPPQPAGTAAGGGAYSIPLGR